LPWFPEAASSYAADIDWLFLFITIIVGAWFVVAEVLLIYLVLRYLRRPGSRAAYLPARGLRAMSVVLIPCAVILGFDLVIDAVAAPIWDEVPPHDELVRVSGEQWAWRFTYPGPDGQLDTEDDVETVNELHVPVDKVIQFELTAKDVLHSFFVPELRLKQDAVPGRVIRGWFVATKTGSYEIPCAEICGFAHTMMKGNLVVESESAYQEWFGSKLAAAAEASGQEESERG
jgi:cytochrome c oxidase subunit 2